MITLVNCVTPHDVVGGLPVPPPGLLSLAGAIREAGIAVRFADLATTGHSVPAPEDLPEWMGELTPVVGFSTMSNMLPYALEAARCLKERCPECVVLLGGCGAQAALQEILQTFPFVDFAFHGEGEEVVPRFLKNLTAPGTWPGIPGLAFRTNGHVVINPTAPRIADLDRLAMPAYDLVDFSAYNPSVSLMTSRGCPFRCTYCESVAFWDQRVTTMSVRRLLSEINLLRTQFKVTRVGFADDTFTTRRARAKAFCQTYLEDGCDFHWGCASRVDGIAPELMDVMAQANCQDLYFGIESGSEATLRAIRKGISRARICDVVPRAKERFPTVTASFMWGFPFETLADLEETLLLAAYLQTFDITTQLHLWSPMPRSALFEQYRHQLVYDPGYQSNIVLANVARFQPLIRSHPSIFAPFYHAPHPDLDKKKRMIESMGFSG